MKLNEKEFKELLASTEFLTRMTIGQFNRIEDILDKEGYVEYEEIEKKEQELKSFVFPQLSPRASYSIGGEKVAKIGKLAWEIHGVMRYFMAWQEHPEGGFGVNFYKPLKITEEPFIEVEFDGEYCLKNVNKEQEEVMKLSNEVYRALKQKDSKPLIEYLIRISENKDGEEAIKELVEKWIN